MWGMNRIRDGELRRMVQHRVGIPRQDKEWQKVGGCVQWHDTRDRTCGHNALCRVEVRGMTGEGVEVCSGMVRWIVWVDVNGWEALGLRQSGRFDGASPYEVKGMDGFHTMRHEGMREADQLVDGGTVHLKGEGCDRQLLRVIAILCLWFSSCQVLHLHNLLSCKGEIISAAKGMSEHVIMQVRGGVPRAQAIGDLLGLHIDLAHLITGWGVRRYIVIIGVTEGVRERKDGRWVEVGVNDVSVVVDGVAVANAIVVAVADAVVIADADAEVDGDDVEILRGAGVGGIGSVSVAGVGVVVVIGSRVNVDGGDVVVAAADVVVVAEVDVGGIEVLREAGVGGVGDVDVAVADVKVDVNEGGVRVGDDGVAVAVVGGGVDVRNIIVVLVVGGGVVVVTADVGD
jgi:hypothetical protein